MGRKNNSKVKKNTNNAKKQTEYIDHLPFSKNVTRLEKVKDFLLYHFKFGWFRYLLSFTLINCFLIPIALGTLIPFIYIFVGKSTNDAILVNLVLYFLIALLAIYFVVLIGTFTIRIVTKGYIYYRYKSSSIENQKKKFRLHQYVFINGGMTIVTLGVVLVIGYLIG